MGERDCKIADHLAEIRLRDSTSSFSELAQDRTWLLQYIDARKPHVDRERLALWFGDNRPQIIEYKSGWEFADAIMALLSPPEVETDTTLVFDGPVTQAIEDGTMKADTVVTWPSPAVSNYKVAGGCDQPKCGWMNSTGFCAKAGCPRNKSKTSPEPTQAIEAAREWLSLHADAIAHGWAAAVPTLAASYTARDAATIERCAKALRESVKLQSHYAGLLNSYDGGARIEFNNAEEWIARLDKLKALEPKP